MHVERLGRPGSGKLCERSLAPVLTEIKIGKSNRVASVYVVDGKGVVPATIANAVLVVRVVVGRGGAVGRGTRGARRQVGGCAVGCDGCVSRGVGRTSVGLSSGSGCDGG